MQSNLARVQEPLPPSTTERSVRLDSENLQWFDQTFPWRGSLSQFLNQVLAEYREAWGEHPAPHTVASSVVWDISRRRSNSP